MTANESRSGDDRPLVMHVMHRFDTGGLENGIVNLVNHMAPSAYRHAIVALTTHDRQVVDVHFNGEKPVFITFVLANHLALIS